MLMSVLHAGELFGAASLFGAGKIYVATIRALESTWAVMISESAVKAMMRENTQIAENYMSYLTARIRFLSARIDGFAQGNVEDRVLLYIQRCAVNGIYTPEYSISALSDALCISRTTLYRSLDKLERSGHLVKDGKIIRLCKGKEEII